MEEGVIDNGKLVIVNGGVGVEVSVGVGASNGVGVGVGAAVGVAVGVEMGVGVGVKVGVGELATDVQSVASSLDSPKDEFSMIHVSEPSGLRRCDFPLPGPVV